MPNDEPCPFCGQENTLDGPDKCRGADTRIMGEAADEIERLTAALAEIINPIATLKERAEANGDRLSGQAYAICNSVSYLQDIARKALA